MKLARHTRGAEAQKQTILIFTLSMPMGPRGVKSGWNADGKLYALIRPLPRTVRSIDHAAEILVAGSWRYDFGDGWIAQVDARKADTEDIRQTRKNSAGFAGYEWMVKNILEHGSPYPQKKGES